MPSAAQSIDRERRFGAHHDEPLDVVSDPEVLGLLKLGERGSAFGGNPLGAPVARGVMWTIVEGGSIENAAGVGSHFHGHLAEFPSRHVAQGRGRGLPIGVEPRPEAGGARRSCEQKCREGILCKETHANVSRFAPSLTIDRKTIAGALASIRSVLQMH